MALRKLSIFSQDICVIPATEKIRSVFLPHSQSVWVFTSDMDGSGREGAHRSLHGLGWAADGSMYAAHHF